MKTRFTLEKHKEYGKRLKNCRSQLIDFVTKLGKSYPKNGREAKAAQKALNSMDILKSIMDDAVCKEYSSELNNVVCRCYMSPHDPD